MFHFDYIRKVYDGKVYGHKVCIMNRICTVLALLVITGCGRKQADGKSWTVTVHPHDTIGAQYDGSRSIKIFLAGTIDMGVGEDWQAEMQDSFAAKQGRFILFNPRQEHWDASREGEMDYQVNWELEHLEAADYIIMNILGGSQSPISLLELGLFARSGKMAVSCDSSFYRYDNVRITCERFGVPLYASLDELLSSFKVLSTP